MTLKPSLRQPLKGAGVRPIIGSRLTFRQYTLDIKKWGTHDMVKIVSVAATTALLAATFLVATPALAVAITYTGTRSVEPATINLSITTDGTLGTLTQANITDWTITTNVPPYGAGPIDTYVMTSSNSAFLLVGNNMSATSTKLNYDFGGPFFTIFQFAGPRPDLPGIDNFYGGGFINNTSGFGNIEYVYSRFDGGPFFAKVASRNGFGVVTLATAPGVGGIPEPGSWALLIAGFGLVGAVARRRRMSAPSIHA